MTLFSQRLLRVYNLFRPPFQLRLGVNFSYKSDICLENIYPNSKLNLYTPTKPPETKRGEKFNGFIPIDKLLITYSRSSGPGGQNVNTVSTKVDVRLHLESANWLHPDIKAKLLEEQKTRLTKDGFLLLRSDKTRSQQLNQADAIAKLRTLIWAAAEQAPAGPDVETEEKFRRRKEKNARERLLQKRSRSMTKAGRHAPTLDF